jgi:short-subunit dehydrogenase
MVFNFALGRHSQSTKIETAKAIDQPDDRLKLIANRVNRVRCGILVAKIESKYATYCIDGKASGLKSRHSPVAFEGKVVWVTGASSGIGEALVRAVAERGASVVLSGRRHEMLRAVQASCRRCDDHLVLPLDLADTAAIPTAVEQVIERFGRIDVLINNAGITQRGLAAETPLAIDRRIMEVNYFGPVALTKAVLPSMIARRSGHLVAVSSLLGKFGIAQRSAYAASKHALQGFFDSLRAEVHDAGICVTMICPGAVQTNASMNALTSDGTPYGKMDDYLERGLSAAECAAKIVRAIERRKREIYPAKNGRMALWLSRYMPNLFSRVIRRIRLEQPPSNEG